MGTMRRAFTLIELLVVISITALLLSILMPALNKARQSGRSAACLSRMRQIGVASALYVQDHDGYFAKSSHSAAASGCLRWGPAFLPFLGFGTYQGSATPAWKTALNKFYRCPSDRRKNFTYSYGKNVWFELESGETGEALGMARGPTYHTALRVRRPARTIEFGELLSPGGEDHFMAHFWLMDTAPDAGSKTTQEADPKRHGRLTNFLYLDGHVHTQAFEETFNLEKHIDHWNPGKSR
jgi:prepilin-type N-terminal cleavage/methylation domain-containing protein/prepilin-type processing-associated H-X9-DG protein